jgi:hypothetical protein
VVCSPNQVFEKSDSEGRRLERESAVLLCPSFRNVFIVRLIPRLLQSWKLPEIFPAYPTDQFRPTRRVGARVQKTYEFRVVSNRNVATFIKELVLAPEGDQKITFTPGDYLQLDIPAYETIYFRDFDIPEPFATVWENQHVFDLVAHNPVVGRRNNYSLASNQRTEDILRFNVRISTPPPGQDCPPGVGSSDIFSLKPGDPVSGIGPFWRFPCKTDLARDGLHRRRCRHGSAPCPPVASA